jgi:hypothetical protein
LFPVARIVPEGNADAKKSILQPAANSKRKAKEPGRAAGSLTGAQRPAIAIPMSPPYNFLMRKIDFPILSSEETIK